MIPVFVISLARSFERRAMVVQQMAHLGIDFEFVDATDGKALSSTELAKVDVALAKEVCGHELSFGEIGCAMSHIRVYERIVAEGIERCVVLEDDIYLHMHCKAIIETIMHSCNSEIVFLHHGKAKRWPFLSSLPGGYRLARYMTPSRSSRRGVLSTAGYVLSLAGANKLLQCAYPLRMPSDYLTGRLQLNGLTASGVEPCCLDVDLFTTTIDDRAYGHYLE